MKIIVLFMSMMALVATTGCAEQQRRGTSSQLAPAFDPKEFLCSLSGGPAKPVQSFDLLGRRFTQEERRTARNRIYPVLTSFGLLPKMQAYDDPYSEPGMNLYAELPATVRSDAWIVIGAHYDTVEDSPGADDDASGVTAVLLVAEQLVKLKERRANVLFVFFDQEEDRTTGSQEFAERLKAEGRKIAAVHCIDMVGYDGNHNRAVELAHADPSNDEQGRYLRLYQKAAKGLGKLAPSVVRRTDLGRSDHESFIRQGWPAILVVEEYVGHDFNPNYHGPADTCEKIDYDYIRMNAALVAAAVTEQLK